MAVVADLNAVRQHVIDLMKQVYGDRLAKIVLFGSYARGDFHEESDVDYSVVLTDEVVSTFREVAQTGPLKTDYYSETGITISPLIVAAQQLAVSIKPFFKEIRRDGRSIYERRPAYGFTES